MGNRSPNDDRSDRFNPNNPAHDAAEANEAEQRGDYDDWDDDGGGGSRPLAQPPLLDSTKISIEAWTDISHRDAREPPGGTRKPIARAGPLFLDRTSRWLNLLRFMLKCAMDLEVQSAASVQEELAERALRARIEQAADKLKALHEAGKTLSGEMKTALRALLTLDPSCAEVDVAAASAMDAWRDCHERGKLKGQIWSAISSGGSWGGYSGDRWSGTLTPELSLLNVGSILEQAHDPARFRTKKTRLGWHESAERIRDLFREQLDTTEGSAVWSLMPRPSYSREDGPAADASEDERHRAWQIDIQQVSDDRTAAAEVLKPDESDRWEPSAVVVPDMTPQHRQNCRAALDRAGKLLANCPEAVDPIAVLNAMVAAAVRSEWAESNFMVFGLRLDPLADPRIAALCTETESEVRGLQRGLSRHGYRTMATSIVSGSRPELWRSRLSSSSLAYYDSRRETYVLELGPIHTSRQ